MCTQPIRACRRIREIYRNRIFQLPFFALAGLAAQLGFAVAQGAWVSTATKAFDTRSAVVQRAADEGETIRIVVGLKLRSKPDLDALLHAGGIASRRGIDSDFIRFRFAPTADQAAAVIAYLRSAGFTKVRATSNNLLVTATGTVGQAQSAFNTRLAQVQSGGRSGMVNLTPAQVPAELGGTVLSVLGLNTLNRAHPMIMRSSRAGDCGIRIRCAATAQFTGFDPSLFPSVYNAASLPNGGSSTVGIIVDGNTAQTVSDLHTFESVHGYAQLAPKLVMAGPAGSDTSAMSEYNLDSQTILGVAGGTLGSLIFFVATSLEDPDLTLAYNAAISTPLAKSISTSLGLCETEVNEDGAVATDDQIFEIAVAQGQTFAVASGDDGSAECTPGPGQDYPASSPYVLGVGGTTLTVSGTAYGSETAWSDSGGGPSALEGRPLWQAGIIGGATRGVPDLAFDGNPATGIKLIINGAYDTTGTYGGTSLAAPIFIGLMSRLQAAQNNGLPFPVWQLYGSQAATRAQIFHDVVSGSNGSYSAGPGWDYTAGFGSLNAGAANLYIGGPPLAAIVTYLLSNQVRSLGGK